MTTWRARLLRQGTAQGPPPPSTRPAPAPIQNAPDRQCTVVLVAFGAVATLWLLGGPIDDTSNAYAMVLPPLAVYEAVEQCARAEDR